MGTVTALVSAYYSADMLKARLVNLEEAGAQAYVICQAGSEEERIAARYCVMKATTPGVPTLYDAWNLAINVTESDYLTSANCDDHFYEGGLEALVEYLDKHPDIDIVHGDCTVRENGQVQVWRREGESVSLRACRVGPMPVWRRSLHERFGMFDAGMKVAGDYDFWLRCVTGGAKVAHINTVVGEYWKRGESLEHRNRAAHLREVETIRERYSHASR